MKYALLALQAILLVLLVRRRRQLGLPWLRSYFGVSLAAAIPYGPENAWWWEWVLPISEPALIVLRCGATVEALWPLLRVLASWYRRILVAALGGLFAGLVWLFWGIGTQPGDWATAVQESRAATYIALSAVVLFAQVFGEGRGFALAHAILWTVLVVEHGLLEFGWQMGWFGVAWKVTPAWWWGDVMHQVIAPACLLVWIYVVGRLGSATPRTAAGIRSAAATA